MLIDDERDVDAELVAEDAAIAEAAKPTIQTPLDELARLLTDDDSAPASALPEGDEGGARHSR